MEEERRRGRIKLPEEELRSKQVIFRVNQREFEKLNLLAEEAGLERGHFMREVLLSSKPKKRKNNIPEVNQDLYRKLSGLSNNLNQAVKKLHQNEDLDKIGASDINFYIRNIKKYLIGIYEDLENEGKNK